MNRTRVAIGVDIGGGSVKLGLVSEGGKILKRDSFLTPRSPRRKVLLNLLQDHILKLVTDAKQNNLKCVGVGIGAPGPIDVERGFVYFFPNIPGWKNTPLKALLQRKINLPVFVDNDANVMALAEFRFGAGLGVRNIVALTLGTGIGGGLVIDGTLFHGPTYSAAEIGHLVIDEKGALCGCGNRGCVETFVGTNYFVKEMKKRLATGQKSFLNQWIKKGAKLTPQLAAQAARRGDKFAVQIWCETAEHLGTALAGLVNILNPQKIILGGGLAQSGDLLFKPLRRAILKKAFSVAGASVKVLPAKLGMDAGIVGAAAMVFE